MKKEFTRGYTLIALCLAIIGTIISLITIFLPIFKFEYTSEILNFEIPISVNIFDIVTSSDKFDLLDNLYKLVSDSGDSSIYMLVRVVAFTYVVSTFGSIISLVYRSLKYDLCENKCINEIHDTVYSIVFGNIGLLIADTYYINVINKSIQLSLNTSKTLITIPSHFKFLIILYIVIFITEFYLRKHWKNAMAGKVKPLDIKINISNPKKNTEDMTLELLSKYKELLDNGIITEEEFKARKQQLLSNKNI
ncbi:MAG: SHOCT domain-containing protein [Ruminococcaceae bacterium]|nr:SHOCT domain-containing protein [Oscillospiraceae bacterium]